MPNSMRLIPTILCGGAGSRLWPVSRELRPKPFIRLPDGQTLLQKAFRRGAMLPGVERILTVTNRDLLFSTQDDYSEVNTRKLDTAYVLEPFGRNTAAAVAAAALHVAEIAGDEAIMLILPADHLIEDEKSFSAAAVRAAALAQAGSLVTFGIRPERPEPGYGYIEFEGDKVIRFVEKPTLETAVQYVSSGRYLWNSGMFCFSARSVLAEMQAHCPDIVAAVRECIEHSRRQMGEGCSQIELQADRFARVRDISFDHAVMERSSRIGLVPCSIGWSDVGSWSAIADLTPADANSNRLEGEACLHDVHGCYIRSEDRVVGAVGIDDLLIVDTPDALLVAHKSRAQDVRNIFTQLKQKGHEAYKAHRTVHRPWGTYTVLEEAPGFKIKRIEVKPGARLSLQMHQHRSEHWVVVTGAAHVVNGDREMTVNTNESTYIPAKCRHRLENRTDGPLVIIEVQSGSYVGEDDIVRFEDQYGRAPAAPGRKAS